MPDMDRNWMAGGALKQAGPNPVPPDGGSLAAAHQRLGDLVEEALKISVIAGELAERLTGSGVAVAAGGIPAAEHLGLVPSFRDRLEFLAEALAGVRAAHNCIRAALDG